MSISPTYIGHIATLRDAQLVFQACQDSTLVPVHRRLNDKERTAGIRSGYVYVWNDADSDIKRWTDGSCCWGPSRSSGDFLIYKETITEGPKYRIKLALVSGRPLDSRKTTTKVKRGDRGDRTKEIDDGLIKKSLSLGSFHLVSYYTENDLENKGWMTPSSDPRFSETVIGPRLGAPVANRKRGRRATIKRKFDDDDEEDDEDIKINKSVLNTVAPDDIDQKPTVYRRASRRQRLIPPSPVLTHIVPTIKFEPRLHQPTATDLAQIVIASDPVTPPRLSSRRRSSILSLIPRPRSERLLNQKILAISERDEKLDELFHDTAILANPQPLNASAQEDDISIKQEEIEFTEDVQHHEDITITDQSVTDESKPDSVEEEANMDPLSNYISSTATSSHLPTPPRRSSSSLTCYDKPRLTRAEAYAPAQSWTNLNKSKAPFCSSSTRTTSSHVPPFTLTLPDFNILTLPAYQSDSIICNTPSISNYSTPSTSISSTCTIPIKPTFHRRTSIITDLQLTSLNIDRNYCFFPSSPFTFSTSPISPALSTASYFDNSLFPLLTEPAYPTLSPSLDFLTYSEAETDRLLRGPASRVGLGINIEQYQEQEIIWGGRCCSTNGEEEGKRVGEDYVGHHSRLQESYSHQHSYQSEHHQIQQQQQLYSGVSVADKLQQQQRDDWESVLAFHRSESPQRWNGLPVVTAATGVQHQQQQLIYRQQLQQYHHHQQQGQQQSQHSYSHFFQRRISSSWIGGEISPRSL